MDSNCNLPIRWAIGRQLRSVDVLPIGQLDALCSLAYGDAMNIYGLSLIKNEADIIEQSLRAAAKWCSRIYVFDNGSDDGTWEKVQQLSGRLPTIIPYKQEFCPYSNSIRDGILRHYIDSANDNDWWCILDADEFFIDDPREFLAQVPKSFLSVWKQEFAYYFTEADLEAYRRDPSLYGEAVPIEQRLRYYCCVDYSELRLFRHSENLKEIHYYMRPIYPTRIRVKHFQYRSPKQIQKRLDTRRPAMERGRFLHEKRAFWSVGRTEAVIVPGPATPEQMPERWEERVIPSRGLHYDERNGNFAKGKPWFPPTGKESGSLPSRRLRAWFRKMRESTMKWTKWSSVKNSKAVEWAGRLGRPK
jgi:glycosyl transferase family 2